MTTTAPGRGRMLARALARRCPLCGGRPIFARWLVLAEHCPRCRHAFGREEGYWVGALIVNTGATQLCFFVVFLGGLWVTWPDVPWTWLLVASLASIVACPLVFYPWAKTLWLWLDFALHPPDLGRVGGPEGLGYTARDRPSARRNR